MRKILLLSSLVTLVLTLTGTPAQGQSPTVPQMLAYKPVQPGVNYSTPEAAEQERCKVELQRGQKAGGTAWVLKDSQGRLLRKFADTNNDRYPDQWSYFKDGQEVYRETDSQFRGKPDRYQWLGSSGMKIGIDTNADGKIDRWEAISVEELSQEIVRAVSTKDWSAVIPLLITEPELQQLGAPTTEVNRIRGIQQKAQAKFQETVTKLAHLNGATRWLHLETSSPSRLLAETTGMRRDVLMHYRAMILCETGGKTDSIHMGELVQVGEAWKLIDAPMTSEAMAAIAVNQTPTADPNAGGNDELQKHLKALAELDAQMPANGNAPSAPGPNPAVLQYQQKRAEILAQVVPLANDKDKLTWFKQLVESLVAAAHASPPNDTAALQRLQQFAAKLQRELPGSEMAAHAAYRAFSAEYLMAQIQTINPQVMLSVQNKHMEKLAQFVAQFPQGEDSPEALLQLGMMSEFQNKEPDAQRWYTQMARQFPQSRQAIRANGALKRMSLNGQTYAFPPQVTTLNGSTFNPAQVQGKVVVVYYWATWCQYAANDFTKLQQYAQAYPGRLEIVAINVDEDVNAARRYLQQHNPVGLHLLAPGSLESPAAVQYGLVIFPHLFLVDGQGRVVNKGADLVSLDSELKKLLK